MSNEECFYVGALVMALLWALAEMLRATGAEKRVHQERFDLQRQFNVLNATHREERKQWYAQAEAHAFALVALSEEQTDALTALSALIVGKEGAS